MFGTPQAAHRAARPPIPSRRHLDVFVRGLAEVAAGVSAPVPPGRELWLLVLLLTLLRRLRVVRWRRRLMLLAREPDHEAQSEPGGDAKENGGHNA